MNHFTTRFLFRCASAAIVWADRATRARPRPDSGKRSTASFTGDFYAGLRYVRSTPFIMSPDSALLQSAGAGNWRRTDSEDGCVIEGGGTIWSRSGGLLCRYLLLAAGK